MQEGRDVPLTDTTLRFFNSGHQAQLHVSLTMTLSFLKLWPPSSASCFCDHDTQLLVSFGGLEDLEVHRGHRLRLYFFSNQHHVYSVVLYINNLTSLWDMSLHMSQLSLLAILLILASY